MLDSTYKIYTRIINQTLTVTTDGIILEEQMGFRKGRSTIDALFVLKQIIEKRREYNQETHITFLDLEKV